MKITFPPANREQTLSERGLDFADAAAVFDGLVLTAQDAREITAKNGLRQSAFWRGAW